MRQDIIVGLTLSALLHGGVLFEGVLFPHHPVLRPPPVKEVLAIIDMPKIEPDEPEKIEPSTEPQARIDFAPPSQVDVPQVAPPNSFVQQIQPPPPEGVSIVANLNVIPERTNPWGNGKPVFRPEDLDQIPEARYQTPPQYPFEMKRQGITGQVVVDFIVDSNGAVQNALAAQSSQREFEQAAIQAVSKWKFRPGKKGGRFVNTHMQVPVVFSLNGE